MPLAENWPKAEQIKFAAAACEVDAIADAVKLAAQAIGKLNGNLNDVVDQARSAHSQIEHAFQTKYDVLVSKFNYLAKLHQQSQAREDGFRSELSAAQATINDLRTVLNGLKEVRRAHAKERAAGRKGARKRAKKRGRGRKGV